MKRFADRCKLCLERLEDRHLLTIPVFLRPEVYPTIDEPADSTATVVVADFDGDTLQDILGVPSGSSPAWIRRGTIDGTLSAPIVLSESGKIAVVVDVDHDLDADVVMSTDSGFSILMNQGTVDQSWLGFAPPTRYPQSTIVTLATGDFDQDGATDLALGLANELLVRLNDGTGSFDAGISYLIGGGPKGIVAGDFNADQRIDIVARDSTTGTVSFLHGFGDGNFEPMATQATVPPQTAPLAATATHTTDINQDGRLDLVIVQPHADEANVFLFLGDGEGDFPTAPSRYEIAGRPNSIASDDFNQDSRIDLAIGHFGFLHIPEFGNGPGGASLLLGNSQGGFDPAVRVTPGDVHAVVATDLDRNESTDLLVATSHGITLFTQTTRIWPEDPPTHYVTGEDPRSVVLDDWNADGFTDMAVANAGTDDISVFWGDATGTLSPADTLSTGRFPTVIVSGAFFAPGQSALAVASSISREIQLLQFTMNNVIEQQTSFTFEGDLADAIAVDLDRDGLSDLVTLQRLDGGLSVWMNQGSGNFILTGSMALPIASSIEAGDVNEDGVADLVVTALWEGIFVFLGTGDGTLTPGTRYLHRRAELYEASHLALADVDADGDVDILVVIKASAEHPTDFFDVWFNQGDGLFEEAAEWLPLPPDTVDITTLDWNRDQRTDVVTVTAGLETLAPQVAPGGNVTVLLGRGDGVFDDGRTHYLEANDFTTVTTADIDQDNIAEIVLVNARGVQIIENVFPEPGDANGDGLFDALDVQQVLDAEKYGTGQFATFAEGDWNRDGVFDQPDVLLVLRGGRFAADQLSRLEGLLPFTSLTTVPGDTDLDGDVDFADFLNLASHFGLRGLGWWHGDFDGDSDVDFVDFLRLASRFGA